MKETKKDDKNCSETPKGSKAKPGNASCSVKSTESSGKRKTHKPITDHNAPKKPRSAYILYMSTQKRGENKERSFTEVAQRWSSMSSVHKSPFIELAEAEREEYERQMEAYRKTDAFQQFKEKRAQLLMERKRKETQSDSDGSQEKEDATQLGDVSIFSASFLQFNQAREDACKALRQKSSSLQEENRLLRENINRLKTSVASRKKEQVTDKELVQLKERWSAVLMSALGNVPLSGAAPISKNITGYMERLGHLSVYDPQHPVLVQARAALGSVSFL